jgi:hypothetical protein
LADPDPGCLPRAGLLSNHDLDIEIDGRQQLQQPLKREASQPVLTKRREAGLRDAKRLRSRGRQELALFEYLIQDIGEAQPGLTLGGVGKPQVGEHVSGSTRDRLGPFHVSARHSALVTFWRELSLVKRISRPLRRPLQVEAYAKASECATPSLVESLPLAHDGLEVIDQQGTDRPALISRH